jgi:hypothetical protein
MGTRFRKRWVQSPALIVVFVLFVFGVGTALAASGVGSLVTNGEDGGVTARGSQQPLGSVSATPPLDTLTPGGTGPDVAGDQAAGADDGETLPTSNSGDNAAAGSGSSKLPFTGFVAIPLLVLGAAMLVGGVALRRRSPQTT